MITNTWRVAWTNPGSGTEFRCLVEAASIEDAVARGREVLQIRDRELSAVRVEPCSAAQCLAEGLYICSECGRCVCAAHQLDVGGVTYCVACWLAVRDADAINPKE